MFVEYVCGTLKPVVSPAILPQSMVVWGSAEWRKLCVDAVNSGAVPFFTEFKLWGQNLTFEVVSTFCNCPPIIPQ